VDPIFGNEARIDIELPLDDLDPPPPGPPSRQIIYVPDEDSTFRFVGYDTILWRQNLWKLGCVLTFGILGLLGHWFPRLWLWWVTKEKSFIDINHGFVVVEVGIPSFVPPLDLNGVQDDLQRSGIIPFAPNQIPVSHFDCISGSCSRFQWLVQWQSASDNVITAQTRGWT